MERSVMRNVLVIGDDHQTIIRRYSADTKVERHLFCKRDDASRRQKECLIFIERLLSGGFVPISSDQYDKYKEMYLSFRNMSDFEYFLYITKGCWYDERTGDAYSDMNPNARYRFEKCYEKRLRERGEEGPFCNPFKLKDGELSYSARKGEIDWKRNHMYGTDVYSSVWELVVDGRKPVDENEKRIKDRMFYRRSYFDGFGDKETYVRYSCSFWTYGVAMNEKYEELDYTVKDKDWVYGFYDKYVSVLDDDTLLTLYEVKSLDN